MDSDDNPRVLHPEKIKINSIIKLKIYVSETMAYECTIDHDTN